MGIIENTGGGRLIPPLVPISPQDEKLAVSVEEAVLTWCSKHRLMTENQRVIAACSGGADSMALLLFLLRCREKLGITVSAAHVNHGIRGEAAKADAAFVERFCQTYQIPFQFFDANAEKVELPEHPSEDWARRLRYNWFETLLAQKNTLIATAHTLSDQTETVLLRLSRGTGLHGAAGIQPMRGGYIRPFLCLTRRQTETYCAAFGQPYVQDESNHEDAYARNRLRHYAVPALQSVNPEAEAAVGRFCEQMQRLDEWLTEQAATLLLQAQRPTGGYDLQVLRQAQGPILEKALHRLISLERDPEEKYLRLLLNAIAKGEGAVQITRRVRYRIEGGVLFRQTTPLAAPCPMPPQPLNVGIFSLPGGYELKISRQNYENFLKNPIFLKKDLNSCADCAKIQKSVVLRTRMPGDRFSPAGRNGHKSLKKYFNELAIPQEERGLLPLLAYGSEVVWLFGSGFAEGMAPTSETTEILLIETRRKQ